MIRSALLLCLIWTTTGAAADAPRPAKGKWTKTFKEEINQMDAEFPGQLGIFVRDLRRNETFNYRGDESWYLASGTKFLVALEVFRQVDAGTLTLDSKLTLTEESYVDGAGALNYAAVGSEHPVRYLLEQMMMSSDNTATDLLIHKVGIEKINALAKKHKFTSITLLSEVRRKVYGHLHASASQLKSKDFIQLYMAPTDEEKTVLLEKLIKVPVGEWRQPSIDKAFANFYAESVNSATLESYTNLLGKFLAGDLLSSASNKTLLEIMNRTKTGEKRIKAGLPAGYTFAHKTGTQRKRICDFGIIRDANANNVALISACARGFATTADAEAALGRLSSALTKSGFYGQGVPLEE